MPMQWTAEADAKLMAKIIQICDVKLTGAQMAEIAAAMGGDCTPKALSHRMTHFRKLGGVSATKGGDDKSAKVTKPKATKAPAKRGGKKAKVEAERTPSPAAGAGAEEYTTPPATSSRSKRNGAKRDYREMAGEDGSDAEDDGEGEGVHVEGLNNKVKIEVGEDIGEGLRQGSDDVEED